MKLSINFSLRSVPNLIRRYIQFVLWGFLIFVVLLEFFVVKTAIDMVTIAANPAPGVQAKLVKVNFEQYNGIEKKLEENSQFQPGEIRYSSPFGLRPPE